MNHKVNNLFILIPFIALMAIGITMVSSASIYFADENYGNPFHFAINPIKGINIKRLLTL